MQNPSDASRNPSEVKPPEVKRTEVSPTQEVRFAVVMYGGVSLAIYMNGVAQELFHLVRATAPAERGKTEARPCEGIERVYRKLGQMLQRGQDPKFEVKDEKVFVPDDAAVLTRFIVDVISGTSAGGINGVFLAKALANGQLMDDLKDLWIRVGDIGELLIDKRWGFAPRPQSLLDGGFMYDELLKALEGMEVDVDSSVGGDDKPFVTSPYAEELDLFVTATDISGLTLPIRLANGVVNERRHRSVFHFKYSTEEASGEAHNDFDRHSNPFLAFAARCTSSFPVAFEPMKLSNIDASVRKSDFFKNARAQRGLDDDEQQYLALDKRWRKFFQDYIGARGDNNPEKSAEEFPQRAFGDGGYLDNKPFSYATDTLLRRRADLPVVRKLLFVDPDPQNPEDDADFEEIDVIRNTRAALSPTVATETIREDIQRILERNRLIERLSHFTADVGKDVEALATAEAEDERTGEEGRQQRAEKWAKRYVSETIKEKGVSYGGYYRVKVATVTDDLTTIIASAANFALDSDEFVAIREFVRAWRDQRFEDHDTKTGKESQGRFMLDFDIGYRLRRLTFLRAKAEEMSCLKTPEIMAALRKAKENFELPTSEEGMADFEQAFRGTLAEIQRKLSEAYKDLLRLQRIYRRRGRLDKKRPNPLVESRDYVAETGITPSTLRALLEMPTENKRKEFARDFLLADENRALAVFNDIAKKLKADFKKALDDSSAKLIAAIEPGVGARHERAAHRILWRYYLTFEDYDMVAFPIVYQSGIGEAGVVDVLRVSPYDATSLINERKEDKKKVGGRHKLGGTALGHFGAFFERSWRENDIMWGRLDAAEIIIRAMLPNPNCRAHLCEELLPNPKCNSPLCLARRELVREANEAIIKEEMLRSGHGKIRQQYVGALLDASSGFGRKETLRRLRKRMKRSPDGNAALKAVLDSCVDEKELVKYFRSDYEVDRRLDPHNAVEVLARSTKIVGKMLETLAEDHRVESKRVAWVTRLGQVFWGLVEVAVPDSFWNLLFRHWIKLLYAFELFLIVGGILLLDPGMQRFGAVALAITGTTHIIVKLLGDFMRRGHLKFLRSLGGVAFILVAALFVTSAILGFDELLAAVRADQWPETKNLVEDLSRASSVGWLFRAEPRLRVLALFGIVAGGLALGAVALTGGKVALVALYNSVLARALERLRPLTARLRRRLPKLLGG